MGDRMSKEPNLHEQYWALSFRPLVRPDGSVGMVGVSSMGPACSDPQLYPNLLMAAPLMYQTLINMAETLRVIADSSDKMHELLQPRIDECEKAITFALHGWIMPKIDTSQFGK